MSNPDADRLAEIILIARHYYCECQNESDVRRRAGLLEELMAFLPEARPAQPIAAMILGHCPVHQVMPLPADVERAVLAAGCEVMGGIMAKIPTP